MAEHADGGMASDDAIRNYAADVGAVIVTPGDFAVRPLLAPHVTQKMTRNGGSAIDRRTTRHAGYAKSQHARPRIEPAFGWLKTIAVICKVKVRGLARVDWRFVFASAAFNLLRLPTLLPQLV